AILGKAPPGGHPSSSAAAARIRVSLSKSAVSAVNSAPWSPNPRVRASTNTYGLPDDTIETSQRSPPTVNVVRGSPAISSSVTGTASGGTKWTVNTVSPKPTWSTAHTTLSLLLRTRTRTLAPAVSRGPTPIRSAATTAARIECPHDPRRSNESTDPGRTWTNW